MDILLTKIKGHDRKGVIGSVDVKKGDNIKSGDTLLTIETSKSAVDIVSEYDGTITEVLVEAGQEVSIGDKLFAIDGKKAEAPKAAYSFGIAKAKVETLDVDLVIIGAGPGGYEAAIAAAKDGLNTVIIEKEKLGGTCLNWGCIPTKAFVKSASLFSEMKKSEEFGISTSDLKVDMKKVLERKNNIVDTLVGGIDYLMKSNKIRTVMGEAKIESTNCIKVKNKKEDLTINTKNLILAMGSNAMKIKIPGADLEGVLTNKELLDIDEVPESLTIIGGGVIGMEFAFVFSSFGTKVTIVEFLDEIINIIDDDVREVIYNEAIEKGITIYTGARADEIIKTEEDSLITKFIQNDEAKFVVSEKVLMCVGRIANLNGVDWDGLGIDLTDRKNAVKVNDKMETSKENVYAIGDLNGKMQLAHVASHQGFTAVKNILGENHEMKYTNVPSAIFTIPEIAITGYSEKEAQELDVEIAIGKFNFAGNGKALTAGEPEGFVKIIYDKTNDKAIGGSIIGPHASDLISIITNMIENEVSQKDASEVIYAHPTTAEAVHEGILDIFGKAIHK
jgi:dihydrolipoamide dehydrogenase